MACTVQTIQSFLSWEETNHAAGFWQVPTERLHGLWLQALDKSGAHVYQWFKQPKQSDQHCQKRETFLSMGRLDTQDPNQYRLLKEHYLLNPSSSHSRSVTLNYQNSTKKFWLMEACWKKVDFGKNVNFKIVFKYRMALYKRVGQPLLQQIKIPVECAVPN